VAGEGSWLDQVAKTLDQGHGRFREIKVAGGRWSALNWNRRKRGVGTLQVRHIGWRSSRPAETHPFMESGDRDRAENLSKCSGSLALIGVSNLYQ
jgi:hypothetical protein